MNGAGVGADNSVHHCQAQTASCELGGEERVEDPGLLLFGDAATGVRDFQPKVIALGQAFGRVPAFAPEPEQDSQVTAVGMRTCAVFPEYASSSLISMS